MRITLLLIALMSTIFTSSSVSNPFLNLYRSRFVEGYSVTPYENLSSFRDETVFFVVDSDRNLTNVTKENPDTIWLKEKRSKKPKEGKDYALCYNFKGVPEGKSFSTPLSSFNNKIFKLESVRKVDDGSYYSTNYTYRLTLSEPESGELIYITLDKNMPGEWKMYSESLNRQNNDWIGQKFYKTDLIFKTIPTEYEFSSGEIYLKITKNYSDISTTPVGRFVLTQENSASPLTLIYSGNRASNSGYSSNSFLTEEEYLHEMKQRDEATKIYEIDLALPADTAYYHQLDGLGLHFVTGKAKNYLTYISQTIKPGYSPLGYKTVSQDALFYIGDKINVRGKDYYKAVLDGRPFFVESSAVTVTSPDDLERMLSLSQEQRESFWNATKALSYYNAEIERAKGVELFKKYADRGLVVLRAQAYDMSEYTDGTGVEFTFYNTTDKTIKYITVNFIGYNAVDDPVIFSGKTVMTRKGIGPIDYRDTATYNFEYVWFTDIVEYIKIKSVVVQYTNGTTRTFTGAAVETLPSAALSSVDSSVEDFDMVTEPAAE